MNFNLVRTLYGALLVLFVLNPAHASPCDDVRENIPHSEDFLIESCPVEMGGVLYFVAYEELTGAELWRSDGTPQGTHIVRDIAEGPARSIVGELTPVGDRLLFTASDSKRGYELWSSDGSEEGTRLLIDIAPGAASSWPSSLTSNDDGLLFFSATRPVDGRELWVFDLNREQIRRVADIWNGPSSSYPAHFAMLNGRLFFRASEPTAGSELWVSDGTAAGTQLFADLADGPEHSSPYNLEVYDGVLHFKTFLTGEGIAYFESSGALGSMTRIAADVARNRTVLTWQPPETNVDGTPLQGLAAYAIYYWTDTHPTASLVQVSADERPSYVFTALAPGTYHFAVATVTADGLLSELSASVTKRID